MRREKRFTLQELYDLLESYQRFHLCGVEITSPIHKAAPELCRQLIELLEKDQENRGPG